MEKKKRSPEVNLDKLYHSLLHLCPVSDVLLSEKPLKQSSNHIYKKRISQEINGKKK